MTKGAGHGPLCRFVERIRKRGGANVAIARKLVVVAWHMLSKGEDYAFARPTQTRGKIRTAELAAGAKRRKRGKRAGSKAIPATHRKELEKELARQAEVAYRRLVADRQPAGERSG